MDRKQADGFRLRVEKIIGANIVGGSVDDETSRWIAGLDNVMHERLAAAGLVKARHSMALGDFTEDFIKLRTDAKPATLIVFGHTRRNLIEFFGQDKPLRGITPGDADAWQQYLVSQMLEAATMRRRCGIAKQMFRAAVRREILPANPFADLKVAGGQGNPNRAYFITRDEAEKVLAECPDAEWRLLFALSRYGGLRCPSEHLALKWADVNWEKGRMIVPSPKTEHHQGGECRVLPIFPELRPYLLEAFEQAEPGAVNVITRYRSANQNLRTQLLRIIKRAGLKPWPKLFHNLRATRETELADAWPEHVVCKWIGNSRVIARRQYLQVTDEHFDAASETDGARAACTVNVSRTEPYAAQNPAHLQESPRKASQNPAQYGAEWQGTDKNQQTTEMQNHPDLPSDSESYATVHISPNGRYRARTLHLFPLKKNRFPT